MYRNLTLFYCCSLTLGIQYYIVVTDREYTGRNLSAMFRFMDDAAKWRCEGYGHPIQYTQGIRTVLAKSVDLKEGKRVLCNDLDVRKVTDISVRYVWDIGDGDRGGRGATTCPFYLTTTTFFEYTAFNEHSESNSDFALEPKATPFDIYSHEPNWECISVRKIPISLPSLDFLSKMGDGGTTGLPTMCQVQNPALQMTCNMTLLATEWGSPGFETLQQPTPGTKLIISDSIVKPNFERIMCQADCQLPDNAIIKSVTISYQVNGTSSESESMAKASTNSGQVYILTTYILASLLLLAIALILFVAVKARHYHRKVRTMNGEHSSTLSQFIHHTDGDGYSRILYPPRPGSMSSRPGTGYNGHVTRDTLPPSARDCDVFSTHYNHVTIKLSDSIREAERLQNHLRNSRILSEHISDNDSNTLKFLPDIYEERKGSNTWHGAKITQNNDTYEKLPD